MPKKTKAIKKTDRDKAWLKKRKASIYAVETKEVNKTILIVCEGQTEKIYFESFPVLTLTVEVVDLAGQGKLKLIESTESINNSKESKYDEIWCVFDMDVNEGETEYAKFDNAIKSANSKGFKVAYSNDSFELWFYLHYQYTDEKNHRTFYYGKLGDRWGCNYEKLGKKYSFCKMIYNRLQTDKEASQEKAIDRARRLFEKQSELPYHNQNPVTLVFKLVEYLNKNCRK